VQTQELIKRINTKPIIKTDGLSKYYDKGKIKALDELYLQINEGETFGLLGPNGAGKTTTVKLLNGIISPTKGTATIKGSNLLSEKDKIKGISGLLAESPGLFEKLSAQEFLEFVGALYKIKGDLLKERIHELLRLFDLFERKDYLLEGYSSGMKQKVLLAAALIHDPEIVYLDEPTASLDPRAAHMVKELIKELTKLGKTIVICSHLLPLVEEVCDRIGIIIEGKLVIVGTIDEIQRETNTKSLEEAFIKLTGGSSSQELLSWRK